MLPEKEGKSAVELRLGNVAAGRGGHGSSNSTAVRQFLPSLNGFTCMLYAGRSRELEAALQGSDGYLSPVLPVLLKELQHHLFPMYILAI